MKMFMIQDRDGEIHLVDWVSPRGNKYAICGVIYTKKQIVNFFGLDAALPNFCQACHDNYNMYFKSDSFRALNSVSDTLIEAKGQLMPPRISDKYWFLEERQSDQIIKYQALVPSTRRAKIRIK